MNVRNDPENLKIGDHVIFVDPVAKQHNAIVTNVWNYGGGSCGCNVVRCEDPDDRTDQYGRQIRHDTSVPHKSKASAHGYYWMFVGDTPIPVSAGQAG